MGSFSRAALLGGVAFSVAMDQYIRIDAHLTVAKTILCALFLSSLTRLFARELPQPSAYEFCAPQLSAKRRKPPQSAAGLRTRRRKD